MKQKELNSAMLVQDLVETQKELEYIDKLERYVKYSIEYPLFYMHLLKSEWRFEKKLKLAQLEEQQAKIISENSFVTLTTSSKLEQPYENMESEIDAIYEALKKDIVKYQSSPKMQILLSFRKQSLEMKKQCLYDKLTVETMADVLKEPCHFDNNLAL